MYVQVCKINQPRIYRTTNALLKIYELASYRSFHSGMLNTLHFLLIINNLYDLHDNIIHI